MAYSELLQSVDFDEILPFIEKYHGHSGSISMYKMHYDMLRHLPISAKTLSLLRKIN